MILSPRCRTVLQLGNVKGQHAIHRRGQRVQRMTPLLDPRQRERLALALQQCQLGGQRMAAVGGLEDCWRKLGGSWDARVERGTTYDWPRVRAGRLLRGCLGASQDLQAIAVPAPALVVPLMGSLYLWHPVNHMADEAAATEVSGRSIRVTTEAHLPHPDLGRAWCPIRGFVPAGAASRKGLISSLL